MKTRLPRFRRKHGVHLLSALILMGAALLVCVHLAPVQRILFRFGTAQIRESAGVDVSASRFRFNLITGTAELDGLTVRSFAAHDLAAVVTARSVAARFRPWSLAQGLRAFEDIRSRELAIQVVRGADGRTNIPVSGPSRQTSWDSLPAALTVEGGSLRVDDAAAGVKIDLPQCRLSLRRSSQGAHDVSIVALKQGVLELGSKSVPIGDASFSGRLAGPDLDVRSLKAAIGPIQTEARGRVQNLSDPVLELATTSRVSLAGLLRLFGANPIPGELSAKIACRGRPGLLVAEGSIEASRVSLGQSDSWSGRAKLKYDQANSRLALNELSARSTLGNVQGSAELSLQPDRGNSFLEVSANDLDLAWAMSLVGPGPAIASRVSGTARATWKGLEWRAGGVGAQLSLAPGGTSARLPYLALGGTARLQGGPDGLTAQIDPISGRGFLVAGKVRLAWSGARLGGELSGDVTNLATLLDEIRRGFPGTIPESTLPTGGSARWTAKLNGSVTDPRLTGAIESASLDLGPVKAIGIAGPVEYGAGVLSLPDTSITWQQQAARVKGHIDLMAQGSPPIRVESEMDRVELGRVLSVLGHELPVSGAVSGTLTAGGTLARPEVEAQLRGEELTAWGEKLGTLTASARASGSRLTVDGLRLEKPHRNGLATLEGTGQFDWENDSLLLQARGAGLPLESTALPGGLAATGVVSLEASGNGPLSAPHFSGHLGMSDLQVSGHRIEDIHVDFETKGRDASVTARAPAYPAALKGDVRLAEPFAAGFVLDAPGLDIGRLDVSLGRGNPMAGSASVRIEGGGPLARPGDMSAKATIRGLELRGVGQVARSRAPVEVEWSGKTLRLLSLTLASEDAALDISGVLPLSAETAAPGEISLSGTASLPGIVRLVPGTQRIEAKGIAKVHGTVRGSFQKLDPALEIAVADAEFHLPGVKDALAGVRADFRIDSAGIEARQVEGRLGGGTVRLRGSVPFSVLSGSGRGEFAQAGIELERIDPGAILAQPAGLAGTISMQADLEAERTDIKNVRITARFSELKLRAGELEISQVGESRMSVADGRFSVDRFELEGPNTEFRVSGSVDLIDKRSINLKASGAGEARLLSVTGRDYGLAGPVVFNLAVGGTADEPTIEGDADVTKGRFFLGTPQISAEDLSAHAHFDGRRVTLTRLTGQLNGGQLEGEGSVAFGKGAIQDLKLKVTGRNIFLDYPRGLRTVSNLDLGLRSEGSGFVVDGKAELLEGEHREAINARTFQQADFTAGEKSTLPGRIRFNVDVKTLSPLSVDNNLARVDAYADLRVVGTAARPALLGRLELDEGGRLYISERTFTVVRAAVNFNSEKTVEPSLDLEAQTRIGEYEVTYRATGGLKDLESSWSADPALSQEQILSLLLTGSPNNTDKISSADIMSRQAFSLFGSTMMGEFNVRIRRALGFSEFRIEPSLISADSDPTARLTVGQNVTPALRLTYSTDLTNSNDQIWVVEYDWRRRVLARYVNESEDSDRGSLLHKLRFGGGPDTGDIRAERARRHERIESVELSGDVAFPEEVVTKELALETGAKYDFLKAQDRVKALGNFYARNGYLETRIRQERERAPQNVRLKFQIEAGPRIAFAYTGAAVPKGVRKQVSEAWRSGFADTQRLQAGSALIRQHMFRERYCDAAVTGSVESTEENARSVTFRIAPGPRYRSVETVLDGLEGDPARAIRSALHDAKLDSEGGTNPEAVRSLVSYELRNRGYLTAAVHAPRLERDPEAATFTLVVPVEPGPAYVAGGVRFEGNRALTEKDLLTSLKLQRGRRYFPEQRDAVTEAVESRYWNKGYRDVAVSSTELTDRKAGTVDLVVSIQENAGSVIAGIQIEGNVKTSEEFIRRRVPLSEGSPVDGEKVSLLRRRLTNPGTYKMGDLSLHSSQRAAATDATRPVDLVIRVREPKPFSLDYGLNYDSETGTGGLADFSLRNVLGEGRLLGYRFTVDSKRRDHRIYFSQPFLGRRDINTTVDLKRERQVSRGLDYLETSTTLQQLVEFKRRFTLSYGYKYSYVEGRLQPADGSGSVSAFISTLSRDKRDDVFDAAGGSYASQSFEYGPGFLGGSYGYYRYFGQFFKYFGLTHPAHVPGEERERPRVVFATGARVGFLDRIGVAGIIPFASERFFGGGSSTIRGFEQNSLGPQVLRQDGTWGPAGGQAVLFLNNELRFPLYKFFDAVSFVDVGNVWASPSQFSLRDVRKTAGVGVRLRNPLIMLRFDYGWKLDRRTGESRGAFHFGIGQAY